MDINEALQVVNNLFDYLSEIGELDEEDFHRMNEAEDVINNYVRKTAAAHGKWMLVKTDDNDMPIYKCSVCGTKRFGRDYYCGHCGTRMDGGKSND